MTLLFISHTPEDAAYANAIRRKLGLKGYTCWRDPTYPDPAAASYPSMIENAILGSAALILIWSASVAQNEWVTRHLFFAQRLKKTILPVVLDSTALPNTLVVPVTIIGPASYDEATAQIMPHLPAPDSQEPLIKLIELAAHEFIRNRKEAIDQAAEMLSHNEHREEVLAILEYVAQHDLMMGVCDKAKEALNAYNQNATQASPPPSFRPEDSRHIFGVRCQKCGQVTYFDKRRVCSAKEPILRELRIFAGKELDTMELQCEQCSHKVLVQVDCEGY